MRASPGASESFTAVSPRCLGGLHALPASLLPELMLTHKARRAVSQIGKPDLVQVIVQIGDFCVQRTIFVRTHRLLRKRLQTFPLYV